MNPHRTAVDPRRTQSVSPMVANPTRNELMKEAARHYYEARAALQSLAAELDPRLAERARTAQAALSALWAAVDGMNERLKAARGPQR